MGGQRIREKDGKMAKKYAEDDRHKVIAVCLSCFANADNAKIIRQIIKEARKHHCKVVFFSTLTDFNAGDLNDEGEQKIFDAISVECYDAIVLMAESFKRDAAQIALVERAVAEGVPVISVNKHLENCINISFDYRGIFKKIVKHMVEDHGFRTINYLSGVPGVVYSEERFAVFKEVLADNNIKFEPDRVFYGYFREDPTRLVMKKILANKKQMPEAFICANDRMAKTVCECLQENGYRVPEDVAVSGFDGVDLAKYCLPCLTTGQVDMEECIRTIFEIIDKKTGERKKKKEYFISGHMELGCSCGCKQEEEMYYGSEIMQLKNLLGRERLFQWRMSQMVARLGNHENLNEVIETVPEYMNDLKYKELWLCTNNDLQTDNNLLMRKRLKQDINSVYTKQMSVIHVKKTQDATKVKYGKMMSFGELIPGREKVFAENDFLLVAPVHIQSQAVGYTVTSFDEDKFWFSAYASFINNLRYILEMQKNRIKVMHMYMSDSLTGLYNRSGFYQKIGPLMENAKDKDMSIISIDMDRLKVINDSYGHSEGDEALRALAEIMQKSINHEIAARTGGDEFLIAFVGKNIEERTDVIVNKIKKGIREYNKSGKKEYELHASIGAYTNRIDKHSLDFFLKKADELMYARKYLHRKEKGYI